jgi:predicted nuclease of predicted toxin-antitoxin system
MRFLIDADLPRSTQQLLESYGHVAIDVRDIGLGRAKDDEIARYAQSNGFCLITGDWGFSDIRHYSPQQHAGIVVVGVSDGATPPQIMAVIRSLLERDDLVVKLPGRLAIVEKGRVRLRPAT